MPSPPTPRVCTTAFVGDSPMLDPVSGSTVGAVSDMTSCSGGCKVKPVAVGATVVLAAYGPDRAEVTVTSTDPAVLHPVGFGIVDGQPCTP